MKKILIVEDDLVLSDMYKLKLEKEGFEVKQAKNGLEGLIMATDYNPDLILLDIMMPSMDGLEALEVLKKQTSNKSKIIVFTNIVDKNKIKTVKKYGAEDYIIKSETNPSALVRKIRKTLKKEIKNEIVNYTYIKPGLNTFKMENPFTKGGKDIKISINIEI